MVRSSSGLCVVTLKADDYDAFWSKVCAQCPELCNGGLKILRSGLDTFVKSIVVEPHYICKDYRSLYSNFFSKKFGNFEKYCKRLHYFDKTIDNISDVVFNSKDNLNNYIGYSVIQCIPTGSIGRTVVDPLKIGKAPRDFCCLRTNFTTKLNGAEYKVFGYPFTMQSGEATVCAHSAMWGVCRYLSERYPIYKETYPYDLIQMTGDSQGRKVPYRGMSYTDYSEILSRFGCFPLVKLFGGISDWDETDESKSAYYDLYSYVESGFPVLVSYKGHVVTIVGHTIDFSIDPLVQDKKGFYNSFSMLKQFIVVDDNCFPYQLLGHNSDPDNYGKFYDKFNGPNPPCIGNLFSAVVPLPEKVFLPADTARKIGYSFLENAYVKDKLAVTLAELGCDPTEKMITRLFIASSSSFKKRKIRALKGDLGAPADVMSALSVDMPMPHFIWVLEFSPLSLFRSGLIIGEITIDASSSEFDSDKMLYLRIGKFFVCNQSEFTHASFLGYYPQYTHNLGETS